ncbi:D-cysteine desulfhydrase family protein [Streptomyces sp. ST2-7A]|uniref:D-cysteine desulfhydrase family protein n=1 Tax=Streptomyces sp. ST2-7A TaxID=2907214 RepID=UPI001F2CA719|nr:D-cysteine desulfhydrase family protein [Streptomyces sp. ST2-7A]MCE7080905.1 D-cysteine desulfhydrase family protein [Streptomyces sp. ST2-7A]
MNPAPSPIRLSPGTYPTPLEPAPRLATAIGLRPDDLWIKRDDLTGVGAGGNKLRKLEYTVGAALAGGVDTLVTTGAPQSNHARLTAAVAARLGLRAVLVLRGAPGVSSSGNLALDGLLGARVVRAGEVGADALAERARAVTDELRAEGARPALIPFGGSSVLGARGYADCARELLGQLPDPRHVVVALGSGGTMAGLVAVLGAPTVLGVDVGARPDVADAVRGFAAPLVERSDDLSDLRIRADQIGAGYAAYTDEAAAALVLAARAEGLILDPIYTGRAMAGLIAAVRDGEIRPGETTVLVHTGGLPGLFGHPDAIARAEALLDSPDGR